MVPVCIGGGALDGASRQHEGLSADADAPIVAECDAAFDDRPIGVCVLLHQSCDVCSVNSSPLRLHFKKFWLGHKLAFD